jgi:hypothetical protein
MLNRLATSFLFDVDVFHVQDDNQISLKLTCRDNWKVPDGHTVKVTLSECVERKRKRSRSVRIDNVQEVNESNFHDQCQGLDLTNKRVLGNKMKRSTMASTTVSLTREFDRASSRVIGVTMLNRFTHCVAGHATHLNTLLYHTMEDLSNLGVAVELIQASIVRFSGMSHVSAMTSLII